MISMVGEWVGEGNSRITVSLSNQIYGFVEIFNSDAAGGAIAANSECDHEFFLRTVADSLFTFEKYSSAALAVSP